MLLTSLKKVVSIVKKASWNLNQSSECEQRRRYNSNPSTTIYISERAENVSTNPKKRFRRAEFIMIFSSHLFIVDLLNITTIKSIGLC